MSEALTISPDDWRGSGDWDDMDVPLDRKERAYLAKQAKQRADNAARAKSRTRYEWPQDEIDRMVGMWKSGSTALMISEALGTRSRSAVMGRIDRMTRAGQLERDPVFNRLNMSNAEHARAKGRRSRGWSKGHDGLYARTAESEKARRLWRVEDTEPEPAVAIVLTFRADLLLDDEFDAVDTGWGAWDRYALAA